MKTLRATGVTILLLLLCAVAQADDKAKNESITAEKFVEKAAQAGMAEVELGHMALIRGENPMVKNFGQRMIEDHGGANTQLQDIALQQGISMPQEISDKQKKTRDELSNLTGSEFDQRFMQVMVKDHKKAVDLFTKASQQLQNPQLQQYASSTLPVLREHLSRAQEISEQFRTAQLQ